MTCYRCGGSLLVKAEVTQEEAKDYAQAGIELYLCLACNCYQNQRGEGESLGTLGEKSDAVRE